MRNVGRPIAVMLVLLFLAPATLAMKVIVASRNEKLSIVDPMLASVTGEVMLDDDPDGDRQPDPVHDVCVSTLPFQTGDFAFVLQDEFVRVIDLFSETILQTHDLATLLGVDLELVGCSAAAPRDFVEPASGLPTKISYLHVVANRRDTGEAWFLVLDQQALASAPPMSTPIPGQGSFGTGTTALGVEVIGLSAGDRHQRAWYQTLLSGAGGDEIRAQLVSGGELLDSGWTPGDMRSFPVTAAVSAPLRMGAPLSRELPILPTGPAGEAVNLDLDGSCALGGDLTAGSTTGPGIGSFTHLFTRRDTDQLLVVDGGTCDVQMVSTGAGPVDVATAGLVDWTEAYTANFDGDSITIIRRDGSTPIDVPIGTGGAVCQACPIAVEFIPDTVCVVQDVRVQLVDVDGDGPDDLRLFWSADACGPSTTEYVVYCGCSGSAPAPTCPCYCDCSLPVPPAGCQCPGLPLGGSEAVSAGFVGLEPDIPVLENKWKELGRTMGNEFTAPDLGGDVHDLDFNVEGE